MCRGGGRGESAGGRAQSANGTEERTSFLCGVNIHCDGAHAIIKEWSYLCHIIYAFVLLSLFVFIGLLLLYGS